MNMRILLIPNLSGWILGDIAREIRNRLGDQYEFVIASGPYLQANPGLLRRLCSECCIVHAMDASDYVVRELRGMKDRTKLVTWIHHITESRRAELVQIAENSDIVLTPTASWMAALETAGISSDKIHVVGYGIDTEFFKPKKANHARWGLPSDMPIVGFVGSKGSDLDDGRKGIPFLREILLAMKATGMECHLIFGGVGWSETVEQFKKLGIQASATGYISRDDLPFLYSVMDVFLVTSETEGGPCTILEAMACETPAVSTRTGLVPDVVKQGRTGFMIDFGDVSAATQSISLLLNDPHLRRRVGIASREEIRAQRDWSSLLLPLRAVYEKLARTSIINHKPAKKTSSSKRHELTSHAFDAIVTASSLCRAPLRDFVSAVAAIRIGFYAAGVLPVARAAFLFILSKVRNLMIRNHERR